MPEEDNTTGSGGSGQAPNPPDGQAPTPVPVTPQAGKSGDDGGMSLTDALEALRKVRGENAAMRKDQTELEELRTARKASEDAKMDAATRATKELGEERTRYTALHQRYTALLIAREAEKLGFHNGDLAATAIAASVEYDKDGIATNVKELLKALKADNPYMVKSEDQQPPQQAPKQSVPPTNASRSTPQSQEVDWKNVPDLASPGLWGRKPGNQ